MPNWQHWMALHIKQTTFNLLMFLCECCKFITVQSNQTLCCQLNSKSSQHSAQMYKPSLYSQLNSNVTVQSSKIQSSFAWSTSTNYHCIVLQKATDYAPIQGFASSMLCTTCALLQNCTRINWKIGGGTTEGPWHTHCVWVYRNCLGTISQVWQLPEKAALLAAWATLSALSVFTPWFDKMYSAVSVQCTCNSHCNTPILQYSSPNLAMSWAAQMTTVEGQSQSLKFSWKK